MKEKIKDSLRKNLTKRFWAVQVADIVVVIAIFLSLSGKIPMGACLLLIGAYALVALTMQIIKVIKKIRAGGKSLWER